MRPQVVLWAWAAASGIERNTKEIKREKMDHFSQQAVAMVEALQFADNVVGRPSTKQKTRMDATYVYM